MPAAILALQAELKVEGPGGSRWIQAEDFFVTSYTNSLSPDEVLTEIRVPVLENHRIAYLKNAPRPSDFAIVGVAVCLQADPAGTCKEIAIGITGVTDKPYRAHYVEHALRGRALKPDTIEHAAGEVTWDIDVNDSIRASKAFRTHLARVWTRRTIQAALEET